MLLHVGLLCLYLQYKLDALFIEEIQNSASNKLM